MRLPSLVTYQYACDALGGFLDEVERLGLSSRTVVAATGDHATREFFQYPSTADLAWRDRVPFLLLAPPAYLQGRTPDLDRWAGHRDIFPTLAGLAGLKAPSSLDGVDFSALLTGKSSRPPRDYVYLEMAYAYVPWPGWRAIRTRDHMYARALDKPWLLFDVTKDPWEMNNLLDDSSKLPFAKQMDDRLQTLMKACGDSWTLKATSGVNVAIRDRSFLQN